MNRSEPPSGEINPPSDPGAAGEAVERTTGASVLRGSFWNVASFALPQFYLLVMSVVAARFLGPHDMGRQSFIAFAALSVMGLFGGTLGSTLTRFVGEALGANRPAAVRGLVGWARRLGLLAAILGGAGVAAVALLGGEPQAAWILAGLGCSLGIMQSVPNAVLTGAQNWRQASTITLVTGTIAVPSTIAVLAAGGGIVGMFAVEAVIIGANFAWAAILARRNLRELSPRPERDPALQRRAAVYASWTLLGIALSVVVYKRSEFLFLKHYASDADIAIYSIAFASVYAVTVLSESVTGVLLPAFATLFGGGADERIRTGFDRAQRLLLMFSMPLAAAAIALGPAAIALVYGSDYSDTGPVLQVMAAGIPLLALMNLSSSFLLGLGKIRPLLIIDAFAAAINVGLAFLLIPPFHAIGAALSNLLSQGVVAIAVLAYALRTLDGVSLHPRTIVANAAAAAAGGGAAALAVAAFGGGAIGLLAGLVAGVVVFAAFAAAIKTIRADDAHWLRASSRGTPLERPVALACRAFAPAPTGSSG